MDLTSSLSKVQSQLRAALLTQASLLWVASVGLLCAAVCCFWLSAFTAVAACCTFKGARSVAQCLLLDSCAAVYTGMPFPLGSAGAVRGMLLWCP